MAQQWYYALFSYLHILSILGMFSALTVEIILLRQKWRPELAKTLATADGVYGISSIAALATGFLRVFYFAKGVDFYFANPVFHAKVTLFIIVGLISIYPTIRFLKLRKNPPETAPPELAKLRRFAMIEIHLLALIPLLGAIMTRGIGL